MSSPLRILELESKLAKDDDGSFRDNLCESLNDELRGVKRHIDSGLPPEEFEQASQYAQALETAVEVVERVWRAEHPGA